MLFHLAIILLASSGFAIALYVYRHKHGPVPLLCPITKHKCETVVHSRYSKLFGIPLEFLGMAYYGFTAVAHIVAIISGLESTLLITATFILSLFAFCFSLYLTAIQAFILREWCTWCLLSASICTAIALLALKMLL
ncbi:MAG: vitamin K epoxide reductase family protein [Patescibacteria group bacterium]